MTRTKMITSVILLVVEFVSVGNKTHLHSLFTVLCRARTK